MTVVVPEVAEAVADGGAARKTKKAASTRRPAQARRFSSTGSGSGGRHRAAGGKSRIPLPSSVSSGARDRARQARAGYGRQARQIASQGRLTPGDRNWQGLILAEFLAAEVVVVLAPLARPSGSTATSGPSPYGVNDLKQIVAIGAVYFVLALASSGSHGKISAAVGGLVLLTLLIRQSSSGQLTELFALFTPATGSAAAGSGTGGGAGVQDA